MPNKPAYDRQLARRVIATCYHDKGMKYCLDNIPHITKKQAAGMASHLGVKLSPQLRRESRAGCRKDMRDWSEIDEVIREFYPDGGADTCQHRCESRGITITEAQLKYRAGRIGVCMTPEAKFDYRDRTILYGSTTKKGCRFPDRLKPLERHALFHKWTNRTRELHEVML